MDLSFFEENGLLKYDFPLCSVCTMKVGGNAKYAFFPQTNEQLVEIISFLRKNGIKYKILGNGSNTVFKDEGYDGAVIITTAIRFIHDISDNGLLDFSEDNESKERYIYVSAGYSLTALAGKLSRLGYTGLEFAYGIPATVGGAVFMNAGAYGGEMSNIIHSVDYLDESGKIVTFMNKTDKDYFGYRHSFFTDHPEYIILGSVLKIVKAEDFNPMDIAEANMKARKDKQPLEYPSCGSAFKRPVGYYAGALIEQAGLKGVNVGGAYVSEKHAGFIINKGNATTKDIIELIELVRKRVFEIYGVVLEPEIKVIEE